MKIKREKPGAAWGRQPGFNKIKSQTPFYRKILNKQRPLKKNIPSPLDYFQKEFPNLRANREWTLVRCVFHQPDKNPSLSINLRHGGFRCFACNVKGQGIVAFHRLKHGLSFQEALRELEALS